MPRELAAMSVPSLPTLTPAELARYSRQILLEEIGVAGQQRIAAAKVLVVGAGGLGSPAALYLAAAGVGTLGIADLDRVELHNLQRQLLHDSSTIGEDKVESAIRRLAQINPHVKLISHREGITEENAVQIFRGYDVIVDGTDNFSARYLNNQAAFTTRKPLVFASVFKFEGQITVFDPAHGGPCYRCLFPEPPEPGSVPGCGEAGVLGAVCGVIGSLQALEAIKLVSGAGEPLIGRLLTYNALTQRFDQLVLPRNPECPLCGQAHQAAGAQAAAAATQPVSMETVMNDTWPHEASVADAAQWLANPQKAPLLLDVREPWEVDICRIAGAEVVPMRQIPERAPALPKDRHILVLCHHGARSRRVTDYLRANGFPAVTNIAGGINAWAEQIDPTMQRY
jgi:adenylyltransferase/sulfurtransferase